MKTAFIVIAACAVAGPALAQEPVGCDKFKWPLDKERATLNGTDLPKIASGASVTFPIPFGTIVALVPFADAKLPAPPERVPKSPDTFAGFFQAPAPKQPGSYKITLVGGRLDRRRAGRSSGEIDRVQRRARLRRHPQERKIRSRRRAVHR